jgi:hypothetical protein
MAQATQERLALTRRINRLVFAEYASVGWFKATTLGDLLVYAAGPDEEVVRAYDRDPHDPARDRDVIRVFLGEWLGCHHPESMGTYALEAEPFRLIDRTEALAAVQGIAAASIEAEGEIGGCLDWLTPVSDAEAADVPYSQLPRWFAALFGEDSRFYLRDDGGPWVVGLAPDAVGMLWME